MVLIWVNKNQDFSCTNLRLACIRNCIVEAHVHPLLEVYPSLLRALDV
jgi:hypothetical protein